MKILFYSYEYPPLGGGVGNALKNILPVLATTKDLEMDIVTTAIDNTYAVEKLYDGITLHKLPLGYEKSEELHKQTAKDMIAFTWAAWFYTWKLLRKNVYDCSHFFGFPGGVVSLLFRWKMRYLISLRGIEVPDYSPKFGKWYIVYKPVAWLVWRFAENVVVNSFALGELARKTMSDLKYKIITNGVDTQKIQPAVKKNKFKKFTITAGGTILGKIKGLDYLIEGFAKLHIEFPDTELQLIGTGSMEAELRELTKELGIEENVHFLGRKPHEWIEANLGRFHVLCLPSLNEGMSNAMLEGLAAGLPLVITETGGTREILENGGNGYVVEQKNSEQIYEKLRILYLDPQKKELMGQRSREIAESMSWEKVGDQYLELYKSIC